MIPTAPAQCIHVFFTPIYKRVFALLARFHGLLKGLGGGLRRLVQRLVRYDDILELILGNGIDGICVWKA